MRVIVAMLLVVCVSAVGYYVLLQEEDLVELKGQNQDLAMVNARLVQQNTALQALSDRCKDDSTKQLTKRGTK